WPGGAIVGRGSRIAPGDSVGDVRHPDRSGEAAIADLLVPSVPAPVRRYPDLELDIRIAARFHRTRHPAKGDWSPGNTTDRLARIVGSGERDFRVGQRESGKVCADRRGRRSPGLGD